MCGTPAGGGVFPTPVGVFLSCPGALLPALRLPHARGGVSNVCPTVCAPAMSSPRPWGCFLSFASVVGLADVFPTPVEVFLW